MPSHYDRVSDLQAQQDFLRRDNNITPKLLQEQQEVLRRFLLGKKPMSESRGMKIGRLREEGVILKDRQKVRILIEREEKEARKTARQIIELRRKGKTREAMNIERRFVDKRQRERVPSSVKEKPRGRGLF